jgi:hypothetical protein
MNPWAFVPTCDQGNLAFLIYFSPSFSFSKQRMQVIALFGTAQSPWKFSFDMRAVLEKWR